VKRTWSYTPPLRIALNIGLGCLIEGDDNAEGLELLEMSKQGGWARPLTPFLESEKCHFSDSREQRSSLPLSPHLRKPENLPFSSSVLVRAQNGRVTAIALTESDAYSVRSRRPRSSLQGVAGQAGACLPLVPGANVALRHIAPVGLAETMRWRTCEL
jgi:hypothetical protein